MPLPTLDALHETEDCLAGPQDVGSLAVGYVWPLAPLNSNLGQTPRILLGASVAGEDVLRTWASKMILNRWIWQPFGENRSSPVAG